MTWPLLATRPEAAQLCSDLAAFSLDFAAYGRAWPAPRIQGDWEGFRRDTLTMIERLFARNPPGRVLRFLDGLTSPAEEIALMASTPLVPMTRAAAGDLLARLLK